MAGDGEVHRLRRQGGREGARDRYCRCLAHPSRAADTRYAATDKPVFLFGTQLATMHDVAGLVARFEILAARQDGLATR